MLEYQDKKFGKVKLVTVTEARANFAALLQDKDTHYIITKNNKPTRVIVNYQAFEELHKKTSVVPPVPASASEVKPEPKGKKSFEHLSGLLEERSEELKSQHGAKEEILVPCDEVISTEKVDLPPRHPKNPKGFKEQDVFIEDDVTEDILDVFQSRDDSYFESGDEGDEASILHPEHLEEVPLAPESLTPEFSTPEVKKQKPSKTNVVVETSFPSEADMTPEQREYFQKYRKLYENPLPSPEVTASAEKVPEPQKALPYDDVTREVERRLAAKWGKNEFKHAEVTMTQEDARLAEDEFLVEPISEDPQDPDGLPSLKDLLKDLEQETLSGDDGNKENMEKGDIDELIHRITHDY